MITCYHDYLHNLHLNPVRPCCYFLNLLNGLDLGQGESWVTQFAGRVSPQQLSVHQVSNEPGTPFFVGVLSYIVSPSIEGPLCVQ